MPTDLTVLFWIILGVVLAAAAVGVGVALRGRKQLPPAASPEELEPTPTGEPTAAQEPTKSPAEAPADAEVSTPEAPAPAAPAPATTLDTIEAPSSRLARLRRRLAGSNNALARGLADLLSRDQIDEDTWDDFEMTLISSDLGVGPTTELTERLRQELALDGVSDPAKAKATLRRELIALVDPTLDRSLHVTGTDGNPAWSWWSASTAPARPPRWASWPACWWPRTSGCCWVPPTPSVPRPPSS